MAILDIFKKKKEKGSIGKKSFEEKPEKKKPLDEKPETKPAVVRKVFSGTACRTLKEPHVSEKATDLTKKDWYAFRVYPEANKVEVKKAVEELYGVNVISVRIVNIPQKKRKLGRTEGWRKGYKKAMVRLKAGQKIEVLPR